MQVSTKAHLLGVFHPCSTIDDILCHVPRRVCDAWITWRRNPTEATERVALHARSPPPRRRQVYNTSENL